MNISLWVILSESILYFLMVQNLTKEWLLTQNSQSESWKLADLIEKTDQNNQKWNSPAKSNHQVGITSSKDSVACFWKAECNPSEIFSKSQVSYFQIKWFSLDNQFKNKTKNQTLKVIKPTILAQILPIVCSKKDWPVVYIWYCI